jgi:hypothetical protein
LQRQFLKMKKILSLILAAVLLAAAAREGSKVEWLEGKEYDFGEVEAGPTHHAIFKFKNVSADTLVIETVRTTCGCTVAEHSLEPVAPGGTGFVDVGYQSDQRKSFHKKIMVFFDRQRKAEILHIRGEQI